MEVAGSDGPRTNHLNRANRTAARAHQTIRGQGERAGRGFIEFFTVTIRNRNTGMTYARGKTIF
jgi:hypothetical protein